MKTDELSSLRGLDLKELLIEIEKESFLYRKTLNLPDNVTFGTEIEYEKLSKFKVDDFVLKKLDNWHSKFDGSLHDGGEVTSPIMKDRQKDWEELKTICIFLREENVDTSNHAGGHIHVGYQILEKDTQNWIRFLKLYMTYEHILFRFAYGDKISARERIEKYARPIADDLYKEKKEITKIQRFSDLKEILHFGKYVALNFCNIDFNDIFLNYYNTIEFRMANASVNEIIWQNNINAFSKMLLSAREDRINMDFVEYKLYHEYVSYKKNEHRYHEVILKDALEFVDLIFDDIVDKKYFLKQYIKGFEQSYRKQPGEEAKIFKK